MRAGELTFLRHGIEERESYQIVGALADDRNWLGWSDVVARLPVFLEGSRVEVLGDDLLTARESIAATYANWNYT
jgi:hypothetical protein